MFLSCIGYQCLNANVFYLIIQGFKCPAVMLVAGIYTITQNPSVFVTGCLHGIRKNIFMLTLSEPSAFRIRCTFLDRFFFFSIRAATTGGGDLWDLPSFLSEAFSHALPGLR